MYQNDSLITAINDYFRILHQSDAESASQLFHNECNLFALNSADASIQTLPIQAYLEILRKRESPRAKGEPRFGEVITVDHTSPSTALVKVLSAVQPKYFLDYLTFIKSTEGWRIVSKVYCEVPAPHSTFAHP